MPLLMLFAFIGGLVTILSPCILPLLPIILSSSAQTGKKRPLGIITGFVLSFTFFTLFLSSIVRATELSAELLRSIAVLTILSFGLIMVIPPLEKWWEKISSNIIIFKNSGAKDGFMGGIYVGLSLGLVWTPCVGPILASIITLAATATITLSALLITLAYSIGTAIPMLAIIYLSRYAQIALPVLKKNSSNIQRIFGVLMILTSFLIYFGYDRKFQSFILEKFPNYGTGLTKIEDTESIKNELNNLKKGNNDMNNLKSELTNITSPKAPELKGGGSWINSEPLTLSQLENEDKVVLIDFWTYSCINCIRTLPHLKSWHQKYADQGLVIIGVHSPEFEFEKSLDNVKQAAEDFGLEYPIVQDNDFNIWKSYNNHYWPAKYLIDRSGQTRYTHFGEGDYDVTENMIIKLLEESGKSVDTSSSKPTPEEYKTQTLSPETYLGYWRLSNFSSPGGIVKDKINNYNAPSKLDLNDWAYEGEWMVGYQHAAAESGSKLHLRFNAKQVHLVMRPLKENSTAKIYLDGKLITNNSGSDVKNSTVVLDKDRLYTLFKSDSPEDAFITIEFPEGGVEVFAFTFG